ncbi:ras-related protein Rab-28-like [Neodiprion fabricii]|uniref:ras-related protein Rab-28-like n=1 Tax=Neodiprion fabricii TaxID=2872261 RepID=UPI001ED96903|nr:ras-related protein Rab-28-like [Neodiprion fabricii]
MSDSEEELFEKRLKFVLVGDTGAGKTSIATRYCNGEFTRHYTPTAGVDFFLKNISLGDYKSITLHIWDVGGLSLHGNMLDKYIFGAHVILFVYDVTNASSFEILGEWIETVRKVNEVLEAQPVLAIIGNKCDMEHQRSVKRDKSHMFAAESGIPCHDVSARTGESITMRVASLAAEVLGICVTKADRGFYKPIVQSVTDDTLTSKQIPSTALKKCAKKHAKKLHKTESNSELPPSKSSICSLQ